MCPVLREVVAEGGPCHVVVGFGGDGGAASWYTASAGPGVLGYVGILDAELNATLRALVKLVPEAESAFLDDADVAGAIGARGRVEIVERNAFGGAAAVVGGKVAVSADTCC